MNTPTKIKQTAPQKQPSTTTAPVDLKGSYKAPDGKIYNDQELLKMYTPEQIQQAIKAGKLKKN